MAIWGTIEVQLEESGSSYISFWKRLRRRLLGVSKTRASVHILASVDADGHVVVGHLPPSQELAKPAAAAAMS